MSLDHFRNFVLYSELLAAIAGTIYYYKFKNSPLKYFLIILWYITLTEYLGWYTSEQKIFGFFDEKGMHYNLWMYNVMSFIFYPVVLMIYRRSIKKASYRKWLTSFIVFYLLFAIINWSFIQDFRFEWSELPDVMGLLFLIVAVCFYFIELLRSETIMIYHKKLLFWISVGLLIFHTGTIPFTLDVTRYALMKGIHNLFLIIWILAIVMYLTFTVGFIWSHKEEKIE